MLPTRFLFGICLSVVATCFVFKKVFLQKTATPLVSVQSHESVAPITETAVAVTKPQSRSISSSSAPQKATVTAQTKQDPWQEQRQLTRKYFSSSQAGTSLAEITALYELEAQESKYAPVFHQALEYVQAHPEESVRELTVALSRFPPELEKSRSYLIQVAAKLEASEEDKVTLLRNELAHQRKAEGPGSNTRFSTSIAFEALMETTQDEKIIFAEARKLAGQYRDSQASRTALIRFAARYPAAAKSIEREFRK